MPGTNRVLDQFHAHLRLCGLPLIALKQKPRVTADLAQSRQLRKNLDLLGAEFLLGFALQALLHALHMGVIERKLLSFELREDILLQLRRKIPQHFPLQTAQDKRPDHALQALHTVFIPIYHDRDLDLLPEPLISI